MTYQQPAYQPRVIQPVVVRPVEPDGGVVVGGCYIPVLCVVFLYFVGTFGIAFIIIGLVMGFASDWDRNSMFTVPTRVLLTIGVIFVATPVCLYCIYKRNKKEQESHENTQPISEPFTQEQMNGPRSEPFTQEQMNQPRSEPFTQEQMNQGAPQNLGPEEMPLVGYDQQPAFAPPAYSP